LDYLSNTQKIGNLNTLIAMTNADIVGTQMWRGKEVQCMFLKGQMFQKEKEKVKQFNKYSRTKKK